MEGRAGQLLPLLNNIMAAEVGVVGASQLWQLFQGKTNIYTKEVKRSTWRQNCRYVKLWLWRNQTDISTTKRGYTLKFLIVLCVCEYFCLHLVACVCMLFLRKQGGDVLARYKPEMHVPNAPALLLLCPCYNVLQIHCNKPWMQIHFYAL